MSDLGHKQKFSDTPDHVRLAPYSGHHVRPVARLIQVLSTMILHVPSKAPTELWAFFWQGSGHLRLTILYGLPAVSEGHRNGRCLVAVSMWQLKNLPLADRKRPSQSDKVTRRWLPNRIAYIMLTLIEGPPINLHNILVCCCFYWEKMVPQGGIEPPTYWLRITDRPYKRCRERNITGKKLKWRLTQLGTVEAIKHR